MLPVRCLSYGPMGCFGELRALADLGFSIRLDVERISEERVKRIIESRTRLADCAINDNLIYRVCNLVV